MTKIQASKVKYKTGFTLIELLLYLALSAAILLAVSVFLSILLRSRIKNQTVAEVEQQGIAVMNHLTAAIRSAENINEPALGLSAGSLSLDAFGSTNDPAVFAVSGSAITVTEGSGSSQNLTSSRVTVSGVSFQNLSRSGTPGIVRAQFTLTYLNPTGKNEYEYSKTFYASASLR
ncbi:MAG: hypothetical protein A3C85_03725 [Candidatus Doudnabacteria bacterium RIFCSPHIGHO2_02_FULL_48_21]|uniref:Prepilin-type N-terminal cleavage/methylation domain-containing protein n=1 Tax=Candidatus Doudnabacteria bacterium RIFCSPLOWO2_02_FULL_48_13 TaxID=1817845 RepID=A0A1F5QBW1_9BACT|nr:MAG: hypothetical protein A3K05_03220 [Candidatus Doudnabacteria bacterium RIFCSPHIGHO2_01_48_18]OGE79618.1 MAG: hypothetical protein A2668_01340 [Candidatus Doudnabacteria bacterium RIFCSPHIGHO2_01_FULL_48_180]OGE91753.1 MAG: hypothetical protein A3F44_00065 [Candidatus Doudnabacteria bacterium RIFCSPHIGHO2_12_FULL_47_25]OGE93566.1 MAG: hypothetical protein A3C85_03725 [Candidatus Doudnabacteria bacterium RIFCSPHIGHO2_02_FULL_48_21]OGE96331.1 MAG: hypothetical protein A3A83_00180 [Candidatu